MPKTKTSTVSHDPQQLRQALLGATGPIILDCETAGLDILSNHVFSYGLRISGQNYILFTEYCFHETIRRHTRTDAAIAHALEPLTDHRPKIIVGHNLSYDLGMLRREGFRVRGEFRDTMQILRMLDQDRGGGKDHPPRISLTSPIPECSQLDYKLKHVVTHLLKIKPIFTPDVAMAKVPYHQHVRYLKSDLECTEQLYHYLWPRLGSLHDYYRSIHQPLTETLLDLRLLGTAFDAAKHRKMVGDLWRCYEYCEHEFKRLTGIDMPRTKFALAGLLYDQWQLPTQRKRSVDDEAIQELGRAAPRHLFIPITAIAQRQQIYSLVNRLDGLLGTRKDGTHYVHSDGRVHSHFSNNQATGRISVTEPNLQAVAKAKCVLCGTFKSRDVLTASAGHVLVAADIEQADVRVLAHMIDTTKHTTSEYIRSLLRRRARHPLYHLLSASINPNYNGPRVSELPFFTPHHSHPLVDLVRACSVADKSPDFYDEVAKQVTGTKQKRSIWKTILLAQINGETALSLAARNDYSREQADAYIEQFEGAFPDVMGWKALASLEIAHTGRTRIWSGRYRQITAHRWLVTQDRVHVLLRYSSNGKREYYLFDATPLKPTLRGVTCFIHQIWHATDRNDPRSIYKDGVHQATKYHPQIHNNNLLYRLPIRNLPYSNISWVFKLNDKHQQVEKAKYAGFDRTARQAINAIMQGGTVDVALAMMMSSRWLLRKYRAKLLNQIHDELVWEVPTEHHPAFTKELKAILEEPPSPAWRVPIRVKMKVGTHFGSMTKP